MVAPSGRDAVWIISDTFLFLVGEVFFGDARAAGLGANLETDWTVRVEGEDADTEAALGAVVSNKN